MHDTALLEDANRWLMNAIGYEKRMDMTPSARANAVRVSLDRACDKELLALGFEAKYTMLASLYNKKPVVHKPIETPIPQNTVEIRKTISLPM